MTPEMDEVRNAALGLLNGCGLGSVLWTIIIAGVRAWL